MKRHNELANTNYLKKNKNNNFYFCNHIKLILALLYKENKILFNEINYNEIINIFINDLQGIFLCEAFGMQDILNLSNNEQRVILWLKSNENNIRNLARKHNIDLICKFKNCEDCIFYNN
jgi:hypothetical protein